MAEDFRGPRLKLHRAQTHIEELRPLIGRFLRLQSYKAVADFELEPGNIIWIARGKDLFPHDEFSPIIGDVVHNLRSALDLAISVLMRNAGKPDSAIHFPTFDSPDAFCTAIMSAKMPKFPEHLVSVLEYQIQPYTGGNGHWLRALAKVSNLDKHRLIVPTVFGVDVMLIETEGMKIPVHFFDKRVSIRDGLRLARNKASEWPQIKANQEARVTLAIEFDSRCGALRGETIEDGVSRLLYATEKGIEALETCL